MTDEDRATLQQLWTRVRNGIEWLDAHSGELGQFHLWWDARMLPVPMPAQAPEIVTAYRDYHQQRTLFERLWRQMVNLEDKLSLTPQQIIDLGGELP